MQQKAAERSKAFSSKSEDPDATVATEKSLEEGSACEEEELLESYGELPEDDKSPENCELLESDGQPEDVTEPHEPGNLPESYEELSEGEESLEEERSGEAQ